MLQADIFIDTRRKTKKGFPVKLQIYCTLTKKRKYIHTKTYQNSKTRRSPEAQEALSQLLNRIEPLKDLSLVDALPLLEKEGDLEIWAMEKKLDNLKKFVDFYDFTRKLIAEKEISGHSTQAFKDAIREVRNYMGDNAFGLNDITYNWAKSYDIYKRRNGAKDGGISYYLRTIRTIHNEAKKRITGIKNTNPFLGLIKNSPSPEHEMKSWTVEDIKRLRDFNHSNATKTTKENMQRVIDLFFFQILIGGHDLIDIANLKWSNIVQKEENEYTAQTKGLRIEFKRYKNRNKPNGGRLISNMLPVQAIEVLGKHGDREDSRIFSFLGNPANGTYTHRNYGATLKRISVEAGIKPHLATKTPRYVFRTVAGELLVHDLIIESILGHKPASISRKYQKRISYEVQDEQHQKILEAVYLTKFEKFAQTARGFDELRLNKNKNEGSFLEGITKSLEKTIKKLKEK